MRNITLDVPNVFNPLALTLISDPTLNTLRGIFTTVNIQELGWQSDGTSCDYVALSGMSARVMVLGCGTAQRTASHAHLEKK